MEFSMVNHSNEEAKPLQGLGAQSENSYLVHCVTDKYVWFCFITHRYEEELSCNPKLLSLFPKNHDHLDNATNIKSKLETHDNHTS